MWTNRKMEIRPNNKKIKYLQQQTYKLIYISYSQRYNNKS